MQNTNNDSIILGLLLKLGFSKSRNLITFYYAFIGKFQIIQISWENVGIKNGKGKVFKTMERRVKNINYARCISILKKEIDIRENAVTNIKLKNIDFKTISASDISSFNFCKVSYAINKSFFIEETLQKSSIYYGTELHKEMKVLFRKDKIGFYDKFNSNFTESQINFLRKINSCELIYSSENNPNVLFSNMDNGYIGKPDYIFKDPKNRYFVVEEKFHLRKSYEKVSESNYSKTQDFFPNNILQLKSYLNYITDYDLQYGILINWYYTIHENYYEQPHIVVDDFTFKILSKNNSNSTDYVMNEIREFQKNGKINIVRPINIKKCISCSVFMYCGHKSESFEHLTIPYRLEFLKTI